MWRLLVRRFLVGLFARLLGTPGGIVAISGHDKAAGVACAPSRNRSDGLRSTSKSLGLGFAAGPTGETDQASAKLRSRRIKSLGPLRATLSHFLLLPIILVGFIAVPTASAASMPLGWGECTNQTAPTHGAIANTAPSGAANESAQPAQKHRLQLSRAPDARTTAHEFVATETGTKGGDAGSRPGKDFTPGGKEQVWENGDGTCANCGTPVVKPGQSKPGVKPPGNEGQVDHVEPKSKGGSGDPSNGQILCRTCNGSKGNKFPWP